MGCMKEKMMIDQDQPTDGECENLDSWLRDLLLKLDSLSKAKQEPTESAKVS